MLDLEVQPERSIGNEQCEFNLGMPFLQAINLLKKQDRVIKGVQVWYSDQNPLVTDLVINLSEDGLRLIFDSCSQTLKIIEVYKFSKVNLKYCGVYFNSSQVKPTIDQIDQSFGATHPGIYKSEQHIFVLNFRGLSFNFHIDQKYEPHYEHGLGSMHFPSNSTPVVSRMYIYSGNCFEDTRSPMMPLACFHGNCYMEHLDVIREDNLTKGIRCFLINEARGSCNVSERESNERVVMFNDSCQDVVSTLGCPSKTFYKSEDKMKIHAPDAQRFTKETFSDYFYNYITLGIDILFDAYTHRVKKFILHTNFPGHYDFNMYYRVFFHLPLTIDAPHLMHQTLDTCRQSIIDVTYNTKWLEVQEAISIPSEYTKPVVLNRCYSTNTLNPFGRTFCYGYQDLIFEVMQNGHIASVTLYNSSNVKLDA